MKKVFALVCTLALSLTMCVALGACVEPVSIDGISIVAPESTEIMAGETFTLTYAIMPEEAAENVKVNWEISDSTKLSYKDGEFTALTFGTVKVTARVKGNDATDEIELKVTAPKGYKEYSATGYQLVYPSSWTSSTLGKIQTWTASNGTPNMNIATEELNESYYTAPAASFRTVLESSYTLMGYTVEFEDVKVTKSKYLGVERVRVDYDYSLTIMGITTTLHQTQMIFNNAKENLSCVLTVTYQAKDFNKAAETLQETVFSQFMPA